MVLTLSGANSQENVGFDSTWEGQHLVLSNAQDSIPDIPPSLASSWLVEFLPALGYFSFKQTLFSLGSQE